MTFYVSPGNRQYALAEALLKASIPKEVLPAADAARHAAALFFPTPAMKSGTVTDHRAEMPGSRSKGKERGPESRSDSAWQPAHAAHSIPEARRVLRFNDQPELPFDMIRKRVEGDDAKGAYFVDSIRQAVASKLGKLQRAGKLNDIQLALAEAHLTSLLVDPVVWSIPNKALARAAECAKSDDVLLIAADAPINQRATLHSMKDDPHTLFLHILSRYGSSKREGEVRPVLATEVAIRITVQSNGNLRIGRDPEACRIVARRDAAEAQAVALARTSVDQLDESASMWRRLWENFKAILNDLFGALFAGDGIEYEVDNLCTHARWDALDDRSAMDFLEYGNRPIPRHRAEASPCLLLNAGTRRRARYAAIVYDRKTDARVDRPGAPSKDMLTALGFRLELQNLIANRDEENEKRIAIERSMLEELNERERMHREAEAIRPEESVRPEEFHGRPGLEEPAVEEALGHESRHEPTPPIAQASPPATQQQAEAPKPEPHPTEDPAAEPSSWQSPAPEPDDIPHETPVS